MNVYDFDKTIYRGDSTKDFYFFLLCRHPGLIRYLPKQIMGFLRHLSGKYTKTEWKEAFFSFLAGVPDCGCEVVQFWDRKERKIAAWYRKQKQPDDVVVSASPEFLLAEICRRLEILPPVASVVNPKTGRFTGENCRGKEKVRRFYERFPNGKIAGFCRIPRPTCRWAALAEHAYLVKKNKITPWKLPPEDKAHD